MPAPSFTVHTCDKFEQRQNKTVISAGANCTNCFHTLHMPQSSYTGREFRYTAMYHCIAIFQLRSRLADNLSIVGYLGGAENNYPSIYTVHCISKGHIGYNLQWHDFLLIYRSHVLCSRDLRQLEFTSEKYLPGSYPNLPANMSARQTLRRLSEGDL